MRRQQGEGGTGRDGTGRHGCTGRGEAGQGRFAWYDKLVGEATWHELRTLTTALQTAGSYDQFSLGASGGLEVISRRSQAIAERHPSLKCESFGFGARPSAI